MTSYVGNIQTDKGIALNTSQNGGDMKNLIINGSFDINQRNNTASSASAFFPADRWVNVFGGGTSVFTTQQATIGTVVGGSFTKCLQITTTNASPTNTSAYRLVDQNIENIYTKNLQWGTAQALPATLTFWAYSPRVGIHNISIQDGSFINSYVAEYSITTANTWEKKTIFIPPATSGANWNNQRSMILRIYCFMGTNNRTSSPNQWLYGANFTGSTNVVDFQTGDIFKLTGIQLEIGAQPTGYEIRPLIQELYLARRYYQVLTNQLLGATLSISALYDGVVILTPEMRTSPTLDTSKVNAYTMNGGPAGTVAIGGTLGGQSIYFANSANNWTLTTFCKVNAYLYADWT